MNLNGLNTFCRRYLKLFEDRNSIEGILDEGFADTCFSLKIEMDCGHSLEDIVDGGLILQDNELLKNNLDRIGDIDILASGIFSKYRYITHWSNGQRLSDEENRQWFIMAFKRLLELIELQYKNEDVQMEDNAKIWGIHCLNDQLLIHDNVIAIGWSRMGDLKKLGDTREAFKNKYEEVFPGKSKGSTANCAGQLYRFVYEASIGDYVVLPTKQDRMINIGQIESDYYFEENVDQEPYDYAQRRKVKWIKHVPRLSFSQGALYEAGSALSFFQIKNYADEYLATLTGKAIPKSPDVPDDTISATAEDIKDNTRDFILKELSKNLKGYDLEAFVADLLRAMGYRTQISPHGGDNGIDITAYKDELPPRIVVQVKSTDSDIKENTLQSLKGAMSSGDYGVFVTLSNFTANATAFLKNHPEIKGIDGPQLVVLILDYYEKLSKKYQKIIPLEKVYIPVLLEESEN